MLRIDVRSNFGDLIRAVDKARADQLPQALAWTLNDMANAAKAALGDAVRTSFDRPTPYTVNAVAVWYATKRRLLAEVFLKNDANKGTPPSKYLAAEIEGGARRLKRFERALQAKGLLPAGLFAVPGSGASLDAYGNMSGPYLVRILSGLGAVPENRPRRRRGGRTAQYFVAGPGSHLRPGIWQRLAGRVAPIILFVRTPAYQARLDFFAIVQRAALDTFPRRFPINWQLALATDRMRPAFR